MTVLSYRRLLGGRWVIVVPPEVPFGREVAPMPARWATHGTAIMSLLPDRRGRHHRPGAGRWTCGTAPIEVVIADDHDGVRAGLAALFDSTPDLTLVGECADG